MLPTLPEALLGIIMSFLEIIDLQNLAKTCKPLSTKSAEVALAEREKIRQEKKKFLRDIVTWVRQHPGNTQIQNHTSDFHVLLDFYIYFNGDTFSPYPEGYDQGKRVTSGCKYWFTRGYLCSSRCYLPRQEGKELCSFHDHVVFSDDMYRRLGRYLEEMYTFYMG